MDDQATYHYGVIERAIREIDAAHTPLSLGELADRMDMSPGHFQRVFSQWVGVSPKRYQQYLMLDHAKTLLANKFSVLDTAYATGLSGSGRLHDLFVKWEAMTPGDYGSGGADLTIFWDWIDTPFGDSLAMATERGLCGLSFNAEVTRDAAMADMTSRWPKAKYVQSSPHIKPLMDKAMGDGEIKLHMIGAPFQIKVWEALLSIPSGHVTTYSEIAQCVGKPKAVRAVGTAVGRNPISWLIPCHRALRKSGELGGYHWGLPVKRALLAWESARAESEEAA